MKRLSTLHENRDTLGALVDIICCPHYISRKGKFYFPLQKRDYNQNSYLCIFVDEKTILYMYMQKIGIYQIVIMISSLKITGVNVTP